MKVIRSQVCIQFLSSIIIFLQNGDISFDILELNT